MDAISTTVANAVAVQGALKIIALTLQLTAYMFPEQTELKHGDQYDFIVVGGGTAGSIVASRLSEDESFKVLLVEAGGDPQLEVLTPSLMGNLPNGYLDWNYVSQNDEYTMQCHKHGVFTMTSGRVLGGSSSLNYMFYTRGNRLDYQRWAEVAQDTTWNWVNVLPYFKKSVRSAELDIEDSGSAASFASEGFVGLTRQPPEGTLQYLSSYRELGNNIVWDINNGDNLGYTRPLYTLYGGLRQSTGYCFLSPAIGRQNLHIRKNTEAIKIVFDSSKNAVGVIVLTAGNEEIMVKANKEIVLSAGALNTPKLLMLSGVGPREDLETLNIKVISNIPVGQNLQDHVTVPMLYQMEHANTSLRPRNPHLYPYSSLLGFVALNKSQLYPDYEVEAFIQEHNSNSILMYAAYNYKYKDFINEILTTVSSARNILLSLVNILRPKSRGQVLLRSANPKDAPLIFTGYFSDDNDLENMATYLADYSRLINTTYFKCVGANFVDLSKGKCSEFILGSKEYWRCYALCIMHSAFDFCGTASIGSVVDSRLRVIGVNRLRVADASVIPFIPTGNINAAIMMIAEKVSDMIKHKHSRDKEL